MARSARKLVLGRLRTRLILFTILLALSEVNALPSCVPHHPGLREKDVFRLLWVVSAGGFSAVSQRRYLRATRTRLHKCSDWYRNILLRSSDSRFREYMRMSRPTFLHVLGLLRNHSSDLFFSRRGAAQLPLELQLALTLYRLGCYGNCARTNAVADCFGVSPGAVVKTTRRVVKALKRLAPMYIKWPNATERAEMASHAGAVYGFSGCIGATDGTTFPLAYQPALHPWTYYDRKGRYSLNAVVTCDWNCKILSVTQGCTGAAPDSFVQTLADWHRHPGIYLSPGEYLLGDKGMKYTARVIGPFLRPECTTAEHDNFNYQLAKLRVRSEHTIGILKGRWGSLRELRLGIGSDKAYGRATDWVLACCVLHNVCQAEGDGSPERTEREESSACLISPGSEALAARQSVAQHVCNFMRATHVFRSGNR